MNQQIHLKRCDNVNLLFSPCFNTYLENVIRCPIPQLKDKLADPLLDTFVAALQFLHAPEMRLKDALKAIKNLLKQAKGTRDRMLKAQLVKKAREEWKQKVCIVVHACVHSILLFLLSVKYLIDSTTEKWTLFHC
jgi:hypothetical protein